MKLCGKCKTATAALELANNTGSVWRYCAPCATVSLYGTAPEYTGALAHLVQYVYPVDRWTSRADLPADVLALCRS
jgi:hypothetical protein